MTSAEIPVVDAAPLVASATDLNSAAAKIGVACRELGFFYIKNHGVDESLLARLDAVSRQFFGRDEESKLEVSMAHGGRAWRGYFPVGGELTSGKPDQKEGFYFGAELDDDHPKVRSGVPLHGRNLFPDVPGFRETILEYLDVMTALGHAVMRGMAVSLGLVPSYFDDRLTKDPVILFRIFHYPPLPPDGRDTLWSVGEHTDYGLLTILRQDDTGGLQVKSRGQWIDAPPIPGTFVCNIGDMLDRMTGGAYRSTPHRVRNLADRDRYSFPFFFDPNWDAEVRPIFPDREIDDDQASRWDQTSLHRLSGTYGEYLLNKVSKVFPELSQTEL